MSLKVRIRFGEPYKNDSECCTGAKMVIDNFAELVKIDDIAGVVLYPGADTVLTKDDYKLSQELGLDLIDAPWETLTDITKKLSAKDGVVLRSLPKSMIANNPYYRQDNPKYFSSPYKFSTVEALIIALSVLEEEEHAILIAEENDMIEIVDTFKKTFGK